MTDTQQQNEQKELPQPTYLVQRLSPPIPSANEEGIKPHHVFGGGMLGLSKEVWKILDPVFTLDYMGSAEFEFGTIPKALDSLRTKALEKELISFKFTIQKKHIRKNWDRRIDARKFPDVDEDDLKPRRSVRTVYALCPFYWKDAVEARIRELGKSKIRCKEEPRFDEVLDPYRRESKYGHMYDPVGWLELDNGFFFFLDEDMWRNTCELFGVDYLTHVKS